MKLQIASSLPTLALEFAARLEGHFEHVSVDVAERHTKYRLSHRPGLTAVEVRQALAHLAPFVPTEVLEDAKLPAGIDLRIELGFDRPLSNHGITVHAENDVLLDAFLPKLKAIGCKVESTRIKQNLQKGSVSYGSARPIVRHLLQFLAGSMDVVLTENMCWPLTDDDVSIDLLPRALMEQTPRQRFEVRVATDDAVAAEPMLAALRKEGFRLEVVDLGELPRKWPTSQGDRPDGRRVAAEVAGEADSQKESQRDGIARTDRFAVGTGPFEGFDSRKLLATVREHLGMLVDVTRTPMTNAPDGDVAYVRLPIDKARRQEMRPYGLVEPASFVLDVRTDHPNATELAAELRALGFDEVNCAPLEPGDVLALLEIPSDLEPDNATLSAVRELVTAFDASILAGIEGSSGLPAISRRRKILSDRLLLVLPMAETQRARWPGLLRQASFHLFTNDNSQVGAMRKLFESVGIEPNHVARQSRDTLRVVFGGVSSSVVAWTCALLETQTGQRPRSERQFSSSDMDVYIELPDGILRANPKSRSAPVVGFGVRAPRVARPFLEVTQESLRIGELTLPRRAGAPLPDQELAAYCLDSQTAEALLHVARSWALREPVLLEGETSSSKTSIIALLAALLGDRMLRVNLHGHVDAAELVGRFVPASASITNSNGQSGTAGFVFQEGPLLNAMRNGDFLLLDEINLAEPQVLERLNSVLERDPSFTVAEHAGELFGRRGQPIHLRFRIFASMNPARYAGRSALSPAYRDRFRGHRVLPLPVEQSFEHMLAQLIFGRRLGPVVEDQQFEPFDAVASMYPGLAAAEQTAERVGIWARFHMSIEAVSRPATDAEGAIVLGANRREPYVFSRRSLFSLLDAIELGLSCGLEFQAAERIALERAYLARLDEQDRPVARQLMDATGLGSSDIAKEQKTT